MYYMGFSFRSVTDYWRGLRGLREIVRAGREREDRQATGSGTVASTEMIKLRFDSPSEVSLLIRVSDVYVIGVENAEATFYFSDSGPGRLIDNQVLLGFGGHYKYLGEFVSLGSLEKPKFEAAVQAASRWTRANPPSSLIKDRGGQKQSADARHLLTLILGTSEAARFPDIGVTVANALFGRRDRPLTLAQIDRLVNRWGELSGQSFPAEVAVPVKP